MTLEASNTSLISPDLWPPSCTGLNLVYYRIWGVIQQLGYQLQVRNIDELKQRLLSVRHGSDH